MTARRVRARTLALATAIAAAAATLTARAQEPATLVFGRVAAIHSAVLNEDRRLNVLLPPGYDAGKDAYPVIVLLDGSAHEDYFHAASLFDFLATYGVMPASIVVGVSNVDRQRDFTLPSNDPDDRKSAPTSGGAARFIDFVERELLPYVASHYRTTARRTMVGQSLGGLVATEILLERPQLFTDYVIVSPSLWWDKYKMLNGAAALLAAKSAPARKVYLSEANEGGQMRAATERFAEELRAARPDTMVAYDYLPNETHATSLHISLYNAMHALNPAKK